jgi:hypothetical protein
MIFIDSPVKKKPLRQRREASYPYHEFRSPSRPSPLPDPSVGGSLSDAFRFVKNFVGGYLHFDRVFQAIINRGNLPILLREAVDGNTRCAIACLHAQNGDGVDLRWRRAISRLAAFAEAMSIPRFLMWTLSSLTCKSGKKPGPSRPSMAMRMRFNPLVDIEDSSPDGQPLGVLPFQIQTESLCQRHFNPGISSETGLVFQGRLPR